VFSASDFQPKAGKLALFFQLTIIRKHMILNSTLDIGHSTLDIGHSILDIQSIVLLILHSIFILLSIIRTIIQKSTKFQKNFHYTAFFIRRVYIVCRIA